MQRVATYQAAGVLPVKVNGDKWRRNREVIYEGVELQHEPELVRGRDELKIVISEVFDPVPADPDEEVDHKEDIKGEVNLLSGVLRPGKASLNRVTNMKELLKLNLFLGEIQFELN